MSKLIRIAIDAMGGDGSPKKVIDGVIYHQNKNKNNNIFYQIFGDKNIISRLITKDLDTNSFEIIHTDEIVEGTDTPLGAAKKGKKTSMWLAVESVKNKKADIVVSAGNTGALLVIAKLNLKMIENIDKPALSALWPNKKGMSVVLDLGANIECSDKNLIDFAFMGSSIFNVLFPSDKAKVALLNIGSEEVKGSEIIKETYRQLSNIKDENYDFKGYIEGNQLMNGDVNVIVADGFTGNVALKTAEGTANFITGELKKAMTSNILGKISALLNIKNLKDFKKRLDPRLYNGAIFIGLDSPVVKSHGGTDFIGFANSLSVCEKIVKGDLVEKIKKQINKNEN
jgi:phosphate acyltransferase